MSNSVEYRNVIIVGAGGSLGSALLSGLLQEPKFKITALLRQSSKSHGSLPASVRIITVPDDYPQNDLVAAFQGQDVVVNALTSTSVAEQYRFVDAAIAAGIKRYVPSEYGLNNLNPKAQELSSVFKDKGEVQRYLHSKESTGLTWTAIACGMWIKWSMHHDFLGLHVADRKMVIWDSGTGNFSCTTLENTALALRNVLLKPAEIANRLVRVSDFAVSQVELLEAIERLSGEKWMTETVRSEAVIKDAKERLAKGDVSAVFKLIETGFVTGAYGSHLEADGPLDNELLGLPPRTLDEVVKEGLESFK